MADRASLLRYAEHDEQPATVPVPWLPEGVNPLGAGSQQLGGRVGEPPPCAPPSALRREPPIAGATRHRLSGRLLAVSQADERRNERLQPGASSSGQNVFAQHCE